MAPGTRRCHFVDSPALRSPRALIGRQNFVLAAAAAVTLATLFANYPDALKERRRVGSFNGLDDSLKRAANAGVESIAFQKFYDPAWSSSLCLSSHVGNSCCLVIILESTPISRVQFNRSQVPLSNCTSTRSGSSEHLVGRQISVNIGDR